MGPIRRTPRPAARAFLAACLLLCAHAAWAPVQAAGGAPGWRGKVAPQVRERSGEGPVECLLVLADQLRPVPPAAARTKVERTRAVFEGLRDHARHTQAPLLSLLDARAAEYRAYWIVNAIWLRADAELLELLARRPEVERIEANPRVRVELPRAGDPAEATRVAAGIEWNVSLIGADAAWSLGHLGEGAVVGGQDTGYQWDHPALKRQYRGWDGTTASHDHNWHDAIHSGGGACGADAAAPCDDHDHGTHTMGTMVGDDGGTNRIGVAPGARWIGCRNMNQGDGTPQTYIECFQWFVAPTDLAGGDPDPALAPDVINNSWTCPASEGCAQDTLRAVVENTRAAGIVVVASAGNAGPSCSTVATPPAIYGASLSVGATTSTDAIASFSSRGPVSVDGSGRRKPDVSAPGAGVRSSVRGSGYGRASGTSMAGPHVAGLVALLVGARPDLRGRVEEIETLVRHSTLALTATSPCGDDVPGAVPNNTFGHGRIDALRLLTGDADLDETPNLEDCAPVDSGLWSAPGEVTGLRLVPDSGGTTLAWDEPRNPGGGAVSFDVLRSTVAADFAGATCLSGDFANQQATDAATPEAAFFYLVLARNACGGTAGSTSAGAPRDVPACP